jgi:superfamily II DNA or RNA helicase
LPPLPPGLVTGAAVTARGVRWRVHAIVGHADCSELHLAAEAGTDHRVLLWPFDRPQRVASDRKFKVLRLAAWTRAVGIAAANALGPLTPRAARASAIVHPYQLAPAVAIAEGAARVLLADEVGLGKTAQAGWIVADLLERERDARVLVAVPAGLRAQWAAELARLFGIRVTEAGGPWLRQMVAELPADVNPWMPPGVYLGSLDFLKRPDVASSLTSLVWDLLIVDEAHTAMAPTDRHGALARVARRSRKVVAITATPYSGDSAGFASLTRLGAMPGEEPPLLFRRSREDVGDVRRRRHRFAAVRLTRTEIRLQRMLERYTRHVWRYAPADSEGARLAMIILRKRALSSPCAAARSLVRRFELLRGVAAPPRQLSLFDDDQQEDDELSNPALGVPGLPDAASEHRWLAALVDAAQNATAHDSKQQHLLRFLTRAAGEPVIVFTEYRDTLHQLVRALPAALQLHGGMTGGERTVVQRQFNTEGGVLLATDAAAEGLNLQHRCRVVVNYELPWNPARLEQRIGRVDRIGQRRTVHAVTLVARDTAEDLVLANLARRLERVAATLGERDRLASFLTDTRLARMVIGRIPFRASGAEIEAPLPPVKRAVWTDPAVPEGAPERCALLKASDEVRRRLNGSSEWNIVVSRLRASAALAPGFVFVVRHAAQTVDGGVAAECAIAIHSPREQLSKPRTRAEALALAHGAAASVDLDAMRIAPGVTGWFDEVSRIHRKCIDLRIARETLLREPSETTVEVQQGLFDRRALNAAEAVGHVKDNLHHEHQRQIDRLECSRSLRLSVAVAAILIVWR